MTKKIISGIILSLAVLVAHVGCGAITEEETNVGGVVEATSEAVVQNEASLDFEPITISHYFGETIIESKPERVVTLGWENQDTPLALGVAPVGCSASNYGYATEMHLHQWTHDAFEKLGVDSPNVFNDTDGFDYEAIADAQPDVILCAYSGMTEEEYNRLSEIAPVVPFKSAPWQTTWREQTILNATGMGMEEEGKAKVTEVENQISEALSKYPNLAGAKTAFMWINPADLSMFYAYLETDPRANFLLDLGLEIPESIINLNEDETAFSVAISRENASKLDDVELIIAYGDESLIEALQADPLMSTIPAVKNGAIALIDDSTNLAAATTPSILSIPACIDEYLELLNNAYEK